MSQDVRFARVINARPDVEFEMEFTFEARSSKTLMTMIQRGLPTAEVPRQPKEEP